ncbi:hypothetical protein ACJW31_11G108400 [Castanea mollissima]
MSITSCLIFLLCLSILHACNARHIRVVDKKLEKNFHFSIKNDEKMGLDLSKVKSSVSKQNGVDKKDSIAESTPSNDDIQKQKKTRRNQKTMKVVAKTSSAVKTESLVSVPWAVPHMKRSEKNPGFNLDYSPPKTHPPSHN